MFGVDAPKVLVAHEQMTSWHVEEGTFAMQETTEMTRGDPDWGEF